MIPNPICFLLVSSHPIVNFEMFPTAFRKKNPPKNTPLNLAFIASGGCGLLPNDESSGDEDLGVANSASEDEEVFPTEELDSIQWGELMISSRRASGAFWHWGCVDIFPVFGGWELGWSQGKTLTCFFRKMELFQKAFGFSFLLLTNCFQILNPQVLRAGCVGFRAMGFWWGSTLFGVVLWDGVGRLEREY